MDKRGAFPRDVDGRGPIIRKIPKGPPQGPPGSLLPAIVVSRHINVGRSVHKERRTVEVLDRAGNGRGPGTGNSATGKGTRSKKTVPSHFIFSMGGIDSEDELPLMQEESEDPVRYR